MLKKIIACLTTASVLAGMSITTMAAQNETPSGIPIDRPCCSRASYHQAHQSNRQEE